MNILFIKSLIHPKWKRKKTGMKKSFAVGCAILAAALYALSIPVSKLLVCKLSSTMLAGLLYLGAGLGMSAFYLIKKRIKRDEEEKNIGRSDIKYAIGMVLLDIMASIFLMLAIANSSSGSVSLLSNFEIVTTSLFAFFLFKEKISPKLWTGIILLTGASLLLSMDFSAGFSFSWYSLFALLASVCWGLENNCTRAMADKSPYQIVIIKGLFSGLGAIIIALIIGERITDWIYVIYALILGFASYGLSVFFYIYAQRYLGASKTSSYYAIAPFIGCGLSFLIFKETPFYTFYIALGIMIIGLLFVTWDKSSLQKASSFKKDSEDDKKA